LLLSSTTAPATCANFSVTKQSSIPNLKIKFGTQVDAHSKMEQLMYKSKKTKENLFIHKNAKLQHQAQHSTLNLQHNLQHSNLRRQSAVSKLWSSFSKYLVSMFIYLKANKVQQPTKILKIFVSRKARSE
jgi:hypothetical protein